VYKNATTVNIFNFGFFVDLRLTRGYAWAKMTLI